MGPAAGAGQGSSTPVSMGSIGHVPSHGKRGPAYEEILALYHCYYKKIVMKPGKLQRNKQT